MTQDRESHRRRSSARERRNLVGKDDLVIPQLRRLGGSAAEQTSRTFARSANSQRPHARNSVRFACCENKSVLCRDQLEAAPSYSYELKWRRARWRLKGDARGKMRSSAGYGGHYSPSRSDTCPIGCLPGDNAPRRRARPPTSSKSTPPTNASSRNAIPCAAK